MRVGLLTGGGDCPGLNAVIRALTKSLIHQCQAEVLGIEDGFAGLMDQRLRHTIVIEINGVGRQARHTHRDEGQQTGRTDHPSGAPSNGPKSEQAHFPSRSRTLRVMRSTIGSRPRSP